MIPDGASHTTLEKINFLQQLAADEDQTEAVRAGVTAEVELIGSGGPVNPSYQRARELIELAEEALARLKGTSRTKRRASPSPQTNRSDSEEPWPVRAFVVTWTELDGWWRHFDVDDLALKLSDAEVELFLRAVDATSDFAERLRTALDTSVDIAEQPMDIRNLRAI
mgnify:CR=1 FL=1